ncbi:major capsid protein [Lysobacter firmicutimachus]|uniref:Major capsid protein n=1 Tax=Lysobacter firmicutimachus TaxID=1792846 RepID=A0ABU8D938_9GAMM
MLYSKQAPRKFDRGTDLHTQSNPLPMCHRPALLPKLKA